MGIEIIEETAETAAEVSRVVIEYHNATFAGFAERFSAFVASLPLPVMIGFGVLMACFGIGMVIDISRKLS